MKTRNVLIIAGVAGVVLIACCIMVPLIAGGAAFSFLFNSTQNMGDTANLFMEHVRETDYEAAYQMLTPDAQRQISRGNFREYFTSRDVEDWNFNNFQINNDEAEVTGTVTIEGEQTPIDLDLEQIDGQWRIAQYDLDDRD
jgi:hypothetical protein